MKRRTPGDGVMALEKKLPSCCYVFDVNACRSGKIPCQTFEDGAHVAGSSNGSDLT